MTRNIEDADRPNWSLQKAKARFSEVVRRAGSEGPQHVTVHGREAVVVVSASEFRRMNSSGKTGADLIAAMQACPHPDFELVQPSVYMRVSDPVEF